MKCKKIAEKDVKGENSVSKILPKCDILVKV